MAHSSAHIPLTMTILLTFLSFSLVLGGTVSAKPVNAIRDTPHSIPLYRNFNPSEITERDFVLRNTQHLQARGLVKRDISGTSLIHTPGVFNLFIASVGVGVPVTQYNLIVDTGSSFTWIRSSKPYVPTKTSSDMKTPFNVLYGSMGANGTIFCDTLTLGTGLNVSQQPIGVALKTDGLDEKKVDGILGLGLEELNSGIPYGYRTMVANNLYNQQKIKSPTFGISFVPIKEDKSVAGEISWGQSNPEKYVGSIEMVPVTKSGGGFWSFYQEITYGDKQIPILSTYGLVDTGSSLVMLSQETFEKYKQVTGAVLDTSNGLLAIKASDYDNLQSLHFKIGNGIYELTRNAQILPRKPIGSPGSDIIHLIFQQMSPSSNGIDFILGYPFLQRFYSYYDFYNEQLGFAETPHTRDEVN